MRTAQSKILSRDAVASEVAKLRRAGKRIVLANGVFDTLHVGHTRYLAGAKQEGDILVVAINSDSSTRALKGPDRPILDEQARALLVAGLRDVDYVLIFSDPHVDSLLAELRPDVHAKGTDYTAESVPERETSRRLGVRVAIVGDPKNHSTRDFLEAVRKGPHV